MALIATIAVAIGAADLPYGYYTLLRLFLCGGSLYLAFGARLRIEDWQRWLLAGLAVLYNPLFPVTIGDKGIWLIANVITVVTFWFVSRRDES